MPKKMMTEISVSDIESLRKRFQLVEGDRKAYVQTFEQTKRQNDDRIREIRVANQELRSRIAEKKKFSSSNSSSSSSTSEIENLTRQLHRLRASHDKYRHRSQNMRIELQAMEDTLHEMERQSEPMRAVSMNQKIRILENRLDKAMIKFNEAQAIRTTYQQIVKRLKDERIGLDNQLSALERTLEVKRNDYDELMLLSGYVLMLECFERLLVFLFFSVFLSLSLSHTHSLTHSLTHSHTHTHIFSHNNNNNNNSEANHSRDVALRQLKDAEKSFREHARHRELELKDREFVVKQRRELKKRVEERQKERSDVIAKTSSNMNLEDEEKLRKTLLESKVRKTQCEEESSTLREKLKMFESAFGQIREATGVSDVQEVLQKISTQESTRENLTKLSKENQLKIEELQELLKKAGVRLEELKYAGPSARSGARKIIDEIEQKCTCVCVCVCLSIALSLSLSLHLRLNHSPYFPL